MKTCIHCGLTKPLDAFRKAARMRDGRENGCKDCHNARRRVRYAASPYLVLSSNRAWVSAHREQICAYRQQYSARHVDKKRAARRAEIDGLSDSYVRQIIINGNPNLTHKDIPQPLVEAHREMLKIKRFLRENSKRTP